jgi:hypothetical protein
MNAGPPFPTPVADLRAVAGSIARHARGARCAGVSRAQIVWEEDRMRELRLTEGMSFWEASDLMARERPSKPWNMTRA